MCKKIKVFYKSSQNTFSGQHLFWPQMSYSTQPGNFWEEQWPVWAPAPSAIALALHYRKQFSRYICNQKNFEVKIMLIHSPCILWLGNARETLSKVIRSLSVNHSTVQARRPTVIAIMLNEKEKIYILFLAKTWTCTKCFSKFWKLKIHSSVFLLPISNIAGYWEEVLITEYVTWKQQAREEKEGFIAFLNKTLW